MQQQDEQEQTMDGGMVLRTSEHYSIADRVSMKPSSITLSSRTQQKQQLLEQGISPELPQKHNTRAGVDVGKAFAMGITGHAASEMALQEVTCHNRLLPRNKLGPMTMLMKVYLLLWRIWY